ncbi:MAG: inorganic diphosphatase [Acidobacteriota bacterium]|nr:MAG: inorganic diphosphatase [Acidobacteriota bacterium]
MQVPVLIEIPKGSRNKYEYDKELKVIKFDRMLFSSVHYPADYGYIPETLAADGDPLDVLVLVWEPTFPGCLIETKPIGVLKMRDDKGEDEKILAVPVSDPLWNHLNELEDAPPHLVREIEHFFAVYKELEHKKVEIDGWEGRVAAEKVIGDCFERFAREG